MQSKINFLKRRHIMKRKKMYFDKLSGLEKWVTDKQVEIVGLIALGNTRTTNTATWPYHTCESLPPSTVTLQVQNNFSQQIIPSIHRVLRLKWPVSNGILVQWGTEGGFSVFSPGLHVRSEWPWCDSVLLTPELLLLFMGWQASGVNGWYNPLVWFWCCCRLYLALYL